MSVDGKMEITLEDGQIVVREDGKVRDRQGAIVTSGSFQAPALSPTTRLDQFQEEEEDVSYPSSWDPSTLGKVDDDATRKYASSWIKTHPSPSVEAIATLIHNSFVAGEEGRKLDWNDEPIRLARLDSLGWQEKFTKRNGKAVFTVVSEYCAVKLLGLREGRVWVTNGPNVNLMPAETLVVPLKSDEEEED